LSKYDLEFFETLQISKDRGRKAPMKKNAASSQKADDLESINSLEWESWLKVNHAKQPGVWIVFPKKTTNEPVITFEQALDIALSYGWIDISISKIDDRKYARKFTPRRENSSWSESNIENVERLIKERRMTRWGLEAFERRKTPD
jgi:uncharacterized protein YdeI (YjbR/CyaY-like superfamily)